LSYLFGALGVPHALLTLFWVLFFVEERCPCFLPVLDLFFLLGLDGFIKLPTLFKECCLLFVVAELLLRVELFPRVQSVFLAVSPIPSFDWFFSHRIDVFFVFPSARVVPVFGTASP